MKRIVALYIILTMFMCIAFPIYATTQKDTMSPIVKSINPSNNMTNVPINQLITITFNEKIFKGKTFSQISFNSNGNEVDCSIEISKNILKIKPKSELKCNSIYNLTIPKSAINDINNNTLKNIYNYKFSTSLSLPFKYITVKGEIALETCLNLRKKYKGKVTPVILGSYDDVNNLLDGLSSNKKSPKEIIEKSLKYNAETLVQKRLKNDFDFYNNMPMGEWTMDALPLSGIVANTDIMSGKPLKEVFIGLIPTGNSYEVPAYLNFGGWNECPDAEEQVGILRYWYEKYGAEVISVTPDILECTVGNPPKTKEKSIDLAKEQYYYCCDIVTQGTESISNLASSLLDSKYWLFWWD